MKCVPVKITDKGVPVRLTDKELNDLPVLSPAMLECGMDAVHIASSVACQMIHHVTPKLDAIQAAIKAHNDQSSTPLEMHVAESQIRALIGICCDHHVA